MKKINILINSGNSFFSLRYPLIKFLLKKKIFVNLYSPNNFKNIKKKVKSKFFKVNKFDLKDNKESLITLILNFKNIYKLFKSNDFNCNLIFGTYLNLIFGVISIFQKKGKNFYIFTGLGSFFNSNNLIFINIIKFFFNHVLKLKHNHYIFYNNADKNFLIKKKFHHKTSVINGSGIDCKVISKKSKKISKKKLKFIFFSRINYHKGLKDLIDAVEIVNNSGYEQFFELYIFGLFDKNPSTIKKNKLFKMIKFKNNCFFNEIDYNVNLKNVLSNKDVFVLPSYREGLPKTALEAMCYKNALLLSNIPGHSMLISNKRPNGIYFKVKNKKDLAKKIIWLLKNKKKIQNYMNNSHGNLYKFLSSNVNKAFYETIKNK